MATFKVGDRVTQPNYGDGTISGADDHHIVIDFDGHGVKRFATGLVVLERTSAPAPARAAKPKRVAKTAVAKTAVAKVAVTKVAVTKVAVTKVAVTKAAKA